MDWALGGVNTSVPRNAGPECAAYMGPYWRLLETAFVLFIGLIFFRWSYPRITVPDPIEDPPRKSPTGRMVLLILICIIWGMEIGYKFSSRTVIYLLNPCHVTTAIQIYLLAASPSKTVTAIFRFHLNLLNGALLAFLFPETDTRLLPLEAAIYWIQHGIMFVVPYYLLRLGGAYNVEEISDITWNTFSYSLNIFYHFLFLQAIAVLLTTATYAFFSLTFFLMWRRKTIIVRRGRIGVANNAICVLFRGLLPTEVNLNHMLCPAILDPFQGQYYRLCAVVHQAILCPSLCKIYCIIAGYFLPKQQKNIPTYDTNTVEHLHPD